MGDFIAAFEVLEPDQECGEVVLPADIARLSKLQQAS